MIDKADLEQWLADTRVWDAWLNNNGPLFDPAVPEEVERANDVTHPDKMIPFLEQVIAMREIVEEIAAEERVTTGLDGLPHCSTCGAGLSEQHRPNCWYTRAVALIGPAGERAGAE